jgi:hypothetical protein
MKRPLILLAAAVLATGAAIAQPFYGPGRGQAAFGLLQHDANSDGRLTRAELDGAQRARFNQIDANVDGTATADEFKAFREGQAAEHRERALSMRFAALDSDGNGQISPSEFAAAPPGGERGRGKRGGPRGPVPARFHGDGPKVGAGAARSLTFADFRAPGVEAFSRSDANKDGVVTIQELRAPRSARN